MLKLIGRPVVFFLNVFHKETPKRGEYLKLGICVKEKDKGKRIEGEL